MIYVVLYSYFLGDIPYREAIAVFSSANRGAKSKVKLNVHTFNWSPRQSAFVCGLLKIPSNPVCPAKIEINSPVYNHLVRSMLELLYDRS